MKTYSKYDIAKHITFITPDVIEVKRPLPQVIFFIAFIVIFLMAIIAFFTAEEAENISTKDVYDSFFQPELLTERKYQDYRVKTQKEIEKKIEEIKLIRPDYQYVKGEHYKPFDAYVIYSEAPKLQDYLAKRCGFTRTDDELISCAFKNYHALYSQLQNMTIQPFEHYHLDLSDYKFWGYLFFIPPVVILFFSLLSPKRLPVRIDKKRRLIYLWYYGRFYIYQIPETFIVDAKSKREESPFFNTILPVEYDKDAGGLLLGLLNEKGEPDLVEPIGAYILEAKKIETFIQDFLLSKNNDFYNKYYYVKNESVCFKLISMSLFSLRYPEKKTEQHIQNWLNKYGSNLASEADREEEKVLLFSQLQKKIQRYINNHHISWLILFRILRFSGRH